jgi:hypothetical protein
MTVIPNNELLSLADLELVCFQIRLNIDRTAVYSLRVLIVQLMIQAGYCPF